MNDAYKTITLYEPGAPEPMNSRIQVGGRVGPYLLIRELGSGGAGMVYLAARDDDEFNQKVAVKILRHGLATEDMLERFRRERQILANLDHPNICRLLDGGTDESGQPYIVMEHVEGLTLDEYCRKHDCGLQERLTLFRKILNAVHFAHQNLVVHCDIKPGNILVSHEGEPKLLDFGIAKLLQPDLAEAKTGLHLRIMTPEYASPEQVRGEPITTVSDIYSLGVLCYELFTGQRPYRLRNRYMADIQKVICEEQPLKPSEVVTRRVAAEEPETVALNSRVTAMRKLSRGLAGDLDNIILMALRKDPQRRYASARQFSDDIDRYLRGFPVLARRETLGYTLEKFIHRHRAMVSAAAALLLTVLGFTLALSQQKTEIRRERDRSRLVIDFMKEVFKDSDPYRTRGERVTARELLARATSKIDSRLSGDAALRAALEETMGEVYVNLGLLDEAEPLLRHALEVNLNQNGEGSDAVMRARLELGILLLNKGSYDEAETCFRQALATARRLESPRELGEILTNLGATRRRMRDLDEAEALYREALTFFNNREEQQDQVATLLNSLAAVHLARRDFDQAEPLFHQALALRRENNDPQVAVSLNDMALFFWDKGDFEQAEEYFRDSLAQHSALLGERHPEIATTLMNLALLLQERGRYQEAERFARRGLSMRREMLGKDNPLVADSLNTLAFILCDQGRCADGESMFRQVVATYRKWNHPGLSASLTNLACLLQSRGDLNEAEPLLREALALDRGRLGEDHPEVATDLNNLAYLVRVKGDLEAAEKMFRRSLDIRLTKLGKDHASVGVSLNNLALVRYERGAWPDGEHLIRQAIQIFEDAWPKDHWRQANARGILGACLMAAGRHEQAEPLMREAYKTLLAKKGPEATYTSEAKDRLRQLYISQGRDYKAAALDTPEPLREGSE